MSLQIHHVLNRVVPAMASGFVIQTTYGELTVEPGELAEALREMVATHAKLELARLEQPTADAQRGPQGFPLNAPAIGEGWVAPLPSEPDAHRPAAQPCRSDSSARSAEAQSQPPCAPAQPGATPATRGSRQ